jgi:hypothetical protein
MLFSFSARVFILLGAATLAACSSQSQSGKGPAATMSVGPGGGSVAVAGGRVEIPSGALAEDTSIAVATLQPQDLTASRAVTVGNVAAQVQLLSAPFAFTPHGTRFDAPVVIELPYSGDGEIVIKLEDESDTDWEVVPGATFGAGKATVLVDGFSVYAVARVVSVDGPQGDGSVQPQPDGGAAGMGGGGRLEGERVVDTYDGMSRTYGDSTLVFDGTRFFWTRDADGKLAIFSADVSGGVPAIPKLIFEAPFAASPGWSNPVLLATADHLVLPVIGVVDLGKGLVDSDKWVTLRKDGSDLRVDVMDRWWVVARGSRVVVETSPVTLLDPASGSSTEVPEFPVPSHDGVCVYDPKADQVGCLGYGIVAYDFKTNETVTVTQSNALKGPQFGSTRLRFNSTHWFAPVNLPSGAGIGAYPREAGGAVVYHEMVNALGAVLVDDEHLFACLDGSLTRISLADKARKVIAEDCGNAYDVSLLGMDAAFVYYVHFQKDSPVNVHSKTLTIYRVAKAR